VTSTDIKQAGEIISLSTQQSSSSMFQVAAFSTNINLQQPCKQLMVAEEASPKTVV
jgi:hypothetical protein